MFKCFINIATFIWQGWESYESACEELAYANKEAYDW